MHHLLQIPHSQASSGITPCTPQCYTVTPELNDSFMVPPSTLSPPVILVAGSQLNPNHPNFFTELEEVVKFDSPSSSLFDPRYVWKL
ncbi:hypothetical protein DSO57_1025495 [Entomophthora muscae]|uniref:Uncharacterized protein n=1 Tax=Entomophthora muscae TaxID=34485 RepID=A0ACC2TPP9_9FUNG|nr:hypothetical protein DSO57_1025495 [Entomophthora muscae]